MKRRLGATTIACVVMIGVCLFAFGCLVLSSNLQRRGGDVVVTWSGKPVFIKQPD
jgi:hypothetical protein